ncbi:SGNH/GDSL hydrolase family protein [Mucilaginibacter agri]|uniref:Acetyl xylan esterase n=1 Tax=Mucilaginibacter agri TaxID=2695265 RepID=A0A966DRZ2_9SPHI|nr:SGNH/GDSL hydrolase family protein [Mucilaginibacter agri]NCD69593.1 acetyl xylan esterase [Mucilaginibacter agri]
MKYYLCLLFCLTVYFSQAKHNPAKLTLFAANNPKIQYTGRIDFADPLKPRFWSPAVYILAKFKGSSCEVILNDEVRYGKLHNYIEIAIDNNKPYRLQITGKVNVIKAAEHLSGGEHTITICKNTESGIGYVEFAGIRCVELLTLPAKPARKIEYIGDSITCGSSMDQSAIKCDSGQWYDQHNAFMSYGAVTARALNAQYVLSSVSGIGLIHSCCSMGVTMPQVFDKVDMRADSGKWNFGLYKPDVVTVCLGQNDGVQDSTDYCSAYVKFIGDIRKQYPKANIVCLSSPMADETLSPVLKKYITAINNYVNKAGDAKVSHYFFSKRYFHGCGTHPDMAEHREMAAELTAYIKKLKNW